MSRVLALALFPIGCASASASNTGSCPWTRVRRNRGQAESEEAYDSTRGFEQEAIKSQAPDESGTSTTAPECSSNEKQENTLKKSLVVLLDLPIGAIAVKHSSMPGDTYAQRQQSEALLLDQARGWLHLGRLPFFFEKSN